MKIKKTFVLFIALTLVFSCDKLDELTEFDVTDDFSTTVSVSISDASEEPQTFSESATIDITSNQEIQDNLDLIQSISVNSVTYEISNYSGIENATVTNASLNFGSTTIELDAINLEESDNNNTIYSITNSEDLFAIATLLSGSQSINLSLSGTISGSPANFDIIITVDITATIDVV